MAAAGKAPNPAAKATANANELGKRMRITPVGAVLLLFRVT
jgi:hypothetical protein